MNDKTCTKCHRSLKVSDFNWRNKKRGTQQSRCRECQRSEQNKFYRKSPEYQKTVKVAAQKRKKSIKHLYLDYLKQQKCQDCGVDDPVVLTHDHRDPAQKIAAVSVLVQRNHDWRSIQSEIVKCDVVCFNCHAKRTAKTQRWYANY